MQAKVKEFNLIFTQKINTRESKVSDTEVLHATKNIYREHHNMLAFPAQDGVDNFTISPFIF